MGCSLWHSLRGCAERAQESPSCPTVLLGAGEGRLLLGRKSLDVAEMLLLLLPNSAQFPQSWWGCPDIQGVTLLHHSHILGCCTSTLHGDGSRVWPSKRETSLPASWFGLPGGVVIPRSCCKDQTTTVRGGPAKPKFCDSRVLEETANSSLQIPPVLSVLQLWGRSRRRQSRDGGPKSNLSRRIRPGIIWLRGCWLQTGSWGSAQLGMSGRATIPQARVGYTVINISQELGGIWRQNGLR